MKISELKIGTPVIVNGWEYEYKGIEKRMENNAKIECFIFYSEALKSEKILHRHAAGNRLLKEKDGKLLL